MRRLLHITLVLPLLSGCGDAAQHAAEEALHEGAAPYRDGRFEEAAATYAKATHDPRVSFNLGNALHRMQLTDSATKAYGMSEPALGDTLLRTAVRYNLANGWTTIALEADSGIARCDKELEATLIEGDDIAQKLRMAVARDSLVRVRQRLDHLEDSALLQGATAYKEALRLSPSDEDARYNLALVQQRIAKRRKEAEQREKDRQKDEDKALSEKALLLIKKADELVDLYKFTEALKVLQDGLKAEPTLQQKQDYMNKLDLVTKAAKAQ